MPTHSSEVRAYKYIVDTLEELGWNSNSPFARKPGQVFTQNECLRHEEIKAALGLGRPENIVVVHNDKFWVIEAKPNHQGLDEALEEAKDRSAKINRRRTISAPFVSGVAGNPSDGFIVKSLYRHEGRWHDIKINGHIISALLSPDLAKQILATGPTIQDFPPDAKRFLKVAQRINKILHDGGINMKERAKTVATLLLAMVDGTPTNMNASPRVFLTEINARAEDVLRRHGKSNLTDGFALHLPAANEHSQKEGEREKIYRLSLINTIQELHGLNIRSAMNSGADVLGEFYEMFLKYGNGAKEIGIVLTPRHITRFAVDALGVTHRDYVLDPACGTGGFLVAAWEKVRREAENQTQIKQFKDHIFGIEQEGPVVALAIVNMIFRGDGKNNIAHDTCFDREIAINREGIASYSDAPPTEKTSCITRVFMNPPFASKAKQYEFVDYALSEMEDGGLLFCILSRGTMVKPRQYKKWRMTLLRNHTLLSVITLPEDLFYPIPVHTVAIVVKKGIPHSTKQRVLWMRAINDGRLKSKGRRVESGRATDDFPNRLELLQHIISKPDVAVPNHLKEYKSSAIDYDDPLFELVPENYLDQAALTRNEISNGTDKLLRDSLAFFIANPQYNGNN